MEVTMRARVIAMLTPMSMRQKQGIRRTTSTRLMMVTTNRCSHPGDDEEKPAKALLGPFDLTPQHANFELQDPA